ncbi:MAG: Na+/H+ antiporter subunit E [Phenylobacterium sp.]|uniref:Na+/H+ antiporter subunit E n=1 Tax=Phenylobacterium sp. TaxID=1871053 RepID=UPI0027200E6A|nr:Na+/H+ antiporter subunit E [Phenylobacterium sp.]MDO9432327.1 Na+/H+ antiporter subunit E [Phenylobacterium sp.]
MRRWLPYPGLSMCLVVIWMLLNQTLAPGQFVVGAVLAVGLAKVFQRLSPPRLRLSNPHKLLLLGCRVGLDVVRSNYAVAKLIILGRSRAVNSGFVTLPLRLTDHYGLAVLACIITSTPGTIWVNYDANHGVLLIHVLDLVDEETWIRTIGDRYEGLLLEIFE